MSFAASADIGRAYGSEIFRRQVSMHQQKQIEFAIIWPGKKEKVVSMLGFANMGMDWMSLSKHSKYLL